MPPSIGLLAALHICLKAWWHQKKKKRRKQAEAEDNPRARSWQGKQEQKKARERGIKSMGHRQNSVRQNRKRSWAFREKETTKVRNSGLKREKTWYNFWGWLVLMTKKNVRDLGQVSLRLLGLPERTFRWGYDQRAHGRERENGEQVMKAWSCEWGHCCQTKSPGNPQTAVHPVSCG